MNRILTADVGNSRIKFGIFQSSEDGLPRARHLTAVPIEPQLQPAAALDAWLKQLSDDSPLTGSVVAGSNPDIADQLLQHWPAHCPGPVSITSFTDIPLTVDVETPSAVGIDRLLTCFAAWKFCRQKTGVLVIDSGTATTINLLTADGTFRGGAIFPGVRLSARAMHEYTARLPLLNMDRLDGCVTPQTVPVPGRSTEAAMIAGLIWGQLGAISELRRRLEDSAQQHDQQASDLECFVTGGGGRLLADYLAPCRYVDSLALYALAILARR